MYARGRCPDWSYTYAGRPAMTAMALVQYIERRLREHSEEYSDTSGKFNASSVSSTSPAVLSSVPTKKSKSKSHKDKDSTGATNSLLPMFAKIESCTPHLKQNIHVPVAPHRYLVFVVYYSFGSVSNFLLVLFLTSTPTPMLQTAISCCNCALCRTKGNAAAYSSAFMVRISAFCFCVCLCLAAKHIYIVTYSLSLSGDCGSE
jgi:hypothetical protein